MTTVRRVAAAAALVLATVLALLAHAVLSVGGARGDSSRSHALLAPLAKQLVPARSSNGAQQAVQDLLDDQGGLGSILRRHAESRAILAKLAASGRPADRSWAANLLGAAAMQDSALDRSNATSYTEQALTAFRQAIHADAGNEDPKFNLELLLTLNRMGRTAQRPSLQPQRRNSKRASAHHREAGFGY
jgi:hypothetical protein